jgi:sugar phosphate permease
MFGFLFLGAQYMQRVLGYDAVKTGAALVPVAVVIGALSLGLSARLNVRFGPRAVLVPGLVLVAAGLALLVRAPVDARYVVDLLPVMLLLGVGVGLALPAIMSLAMSDAGPEDSGLASGLVNTTQQVGGALGLAVLATLSASRTATLRTGGASSAAALTGGYHAAFAVAAALAVTATVLAVVVLRPTPGAEAAIDADAFDAARPAAAPVVPVVDAA